MCNEPQKIQRSSNLHTFLWDLHVDAVIKETSQDPIIFYIVHSASPTKEQIQNSRGTGDRNPKAKTFSQIYSKNKRSFSWGCSNSIDTIKSVINKPMFEQKKGWIQNGFFSPLVSG